MPPFVTLVMFTDGRAHCFDETLRSFRENVDPDTISARIAVNDCPDPNYGRWLDELDYFDHIVPAERRRRGFGGAIRAGWSAAAGSDWIFHLEDDFTFNRPLDVCAMIDVLTENRHLAQMALRRQPWNDEERAAGGIIELHPEDFLDAHNDKYRWVEHRRFFTTNPCVYPHWVTELGWPHGLHSEGRFSIGLFEDPEIFCGFWGPRTDPPWVTHIGDERTGTGY